MAWDLTSKEHTETGQQIIKKLATEEGLAMIKALTDEQADGVELETRLRNFKDRTLPFFRTISHPDILSSLILETPLDTICTFLFAQMVVVLSTCSSLRLPLLVPLLGTKETKMKS